MELNLIIKGKNLQKIDTIFSSITELEITSFDNFEDIKYVYTLSKLKKLDITGCAISDGDLIGISNLINLKKLNLTSCINLTDFSEIFQLSSLTLLNLSHWVGLSDDALSQISNLTNLEILDLSNCNILDIGLVEIFKLVKLKSLNFSALFNIENFTGISNLIELEVLNVSFCNLNDDFYQEILKLKKIVYINSVFSENNLGNNRNLARSFFYHMLENCKKNTK